MCTNMCNSEYHNDFWFTFPKLENRLSQFDLDYELAMYFITPAYFHRGVCKVLLDAGARVNLKNHIGWTPLHFAAVEGRANDSFYSFSICIYES